MQTVYISGPMRGIKNFNAPAFNAAAEVLASRGYNVMNPVEFDFAVGVDLMALPDDYDWDATPSDLGPLQELIMRDLGLLVRDCDAIYMLPGWESSKGACAELAVAMWAGLEVIYQEQECYAEAK